MRRRLRILALVTAAEAIALGAWLYAVDRQLARTTRTLKDYMP